MQLHFLLSSPVISAVLSSVPFNVHKQLHKTTSLSLIFSLSCSKLCVPRKHDASCSCFTMKAFQRLTIEMLLL